VEETGVPILNHYFSMSNRQTDHTRMHSVCLPKALIKDLKYIEQLLKRNIFCFKLKRLKKKIPKKGRNLDLKN
jgi:hypothetical protein